MSSQKRPGEQPWWGYGLAPKSNWRSSPLSSNPVDLRQPLHKEYGRLGRRYETKTPGGLHNAEPEDYAPWDGPYRYNLWRDAKAQRAGRGLKDRAVPVVGRGQLRLPEIGSDYNALEVVNEFLRRLSRTEPSNDRAGSSSDGAPGAAGPLDASQEGGPEDTQRRYTAAEKGKQREGEAVPSITRGSSAPKPAIPDQTYPLAPKVPTRACRLQDRPLSPGDDQGVGDEKDKGGPGFDEAGYAGHKSRTTFGVWSDRSSPAQVLKEARKKLGLAADLPLDGLGVVRDTSTSMERMHLPKSSSRYQSSAAMERTQSQMGATGPRSWQDSVASSSQGEDELVGALAHRRVKGLLSRWPEESVPEAPMPPHGSSKDGVEPLSSPVDPDLGADGQSDADAPLMKTPEQGQPPILPKKRGSSEISGTLTPGPSKRYQTWRAFASSAMVSELSENKQSRDVSWGEVCARGLLPPPRLHKELCKLYSVLVQVVQAATKEFTVVEPHGFVEVLSWVDSDEAAGAEVIRHVRKQAARPDKLDAYRKLLVPFSTTENMYLAMIDLDTRAVQLLHQRTKQDLELGEPKAEPSITEAVYNFIHTVFPDSMKGGSASAWTIHNHWTAQGPVAINAAPGIVKGRYRDGLGQRIQLDSILPFFFEGLRIVSRVEERIAIEDTALLTLLFAIFDSYDVYQPFPGLPGTADTAGLRRQSKAQVTSSLGGRLKEILKHGESKFKKVARGDYEPRLVIYQRLKAKADYFQAVGGSIKAARHLIDQHHHLEMLIVRMTDRCIESRSFLFHGTLFSTADKWASSVDVKKEFLRAQVALHQFRRQELHELSEKFRNMKAELDNWLSMFSQQLGSLLK
jgi:hypothetical protein